MGKAKQTLDKLDYTYAVVVLLLFVESWIVFAILAVMEGVIMNYRCQGLQFLLPIGIQLVLLASFAAFIVATLLGIYKCNTKEATPTYYAICGVKFTTGILVIWGGISQLILLITVSSMLFSALPQTTGTLTLAGLKDSASIVRDSNGVLHITAANDYDLFFAQGVAVAQERLWELEFNRRVARGTLSEIVGTAGLTTDKFARTLGLTRNAAASLSNLSNETLTMIDGYIAGINSYIATNPMTPHEFRVFSIQKLDPFTREDVIGWLKILSWDQGTNVASEIQRYNMMVRGVTKERIYEYYPPQTTGSTILSESELDAKVRLGTPLNVSDDGAFIPPKTSTRSSKKSPTYEEIAADPLFKATFAQRLPVHNSNNWVVNGTLTKSGRPIIANDPHMGFSSPSIWILVHLKSPNIDAIGTSLVSIPGIVIGRNRHIAWAMTNSVMDAQDLYAMEDTDNGAAYTYKGQSVPYSIRTETINVKGAAPITLQVKESVYGPIVNEVLGIAGTTPMSLCWTAISKNDTSMNTFSQLVRSKNWSEFRAAFSQLYGPGMNMVYADEAGNIGYVAVGKLPNRKDGHSGRLPVSGKGDYDYDGYVPFDENPTTFNPPKGWIVTANNRVTPNTYKYNFQYDVSASYRSDRIVEALTELINKQTPLTKQHMSELQMDVKSLMWFDFKPYFEQISVSGDAEAWRQKLLAWDGRQTMDSQETSVWEAWYQNYGVLLGSGNPSKPFNAYHIAGFLLNTLATNSDPDCTTLGKTCMQLAADSLTTVVAKLKADNGGVIPKWGDIHISVFGHRIFEAVAPIKCYASRHISNMGGTNTVNVASPDRDIIYKSNMFNNFQSSKGPAYREVFEMNLSKNETRASGEGEWIIVPPGQNGNYFAYSYDNWLQKWRDGELLNVLFDNPTASQKQTLVRPT